MADKAMPPVPGLARLTWLLFMQPVRFHRLLVAWEMQGDPPLRQLDSRFQARDPVVMGLLRRYLLLLFVCTPVLTFVGFGVLRVLGHPIHMLDLGRGMAAGMALGLLRGVSARGVIQGLAGGVGWGIANGVTGGALLSGAQGAAIGVAGGVAIGMVMCVALSVAIAITEGAPEEFGSGMGFSIVGGLMGGVLVGFLTSMETGIAFGVASGVAWGVSFIRLPTYFVEAAASLLLGWQARRVPEQAVHLVRWLPFRHHDLIYLPLPGLRSFLLQLAETHPGLAKDLLVEADASPGQVRIVRRVRRELQARELERAARNRTFARVADLDLPFLPPASALNPTSPFLLFQTAASDLRVEVNSHMQRRLALERARQTLEDFIASRTLSSPCKDTLSHRLLPTARLWLDVVQEEELKLRADEARHPQVPRAFVAGPPLAPEAPQGESLFQGRRDLARFVEHDLDPGSRGVLVIVGQRRIGKSSFRNWLPRLLGTGTQVVSANFQELSGHPHRAAPHRWLLDLVASTFPDAPPPPTSSHWNEALNWLRARDASLASHHVLIVIDEVERVEDGILAGWCSTDFLDFLRAAGDTLRRIRILLLTAYPLHRLGRHWVDRLISSTIRGLSYLDVTSAQKLVREPIPGFPDIYPEGGVERILRETRCHPFLIQKVCDELCKHLNAHGGRRRATDEELTEVLDRVTEEKLFDELWSQRTVEEQRALHRLAYAKEPLDADLAMRQLAREGYVELQEERATLAVPLFGAWIRLTQGRITGGGVARA